MSETYILELEICPTKREVAVIDRRFKVGKSIYNACLGESRKRLNKVVRDSEYRELLGTPSSKARNRRLREIERSCGYSEYDMHAWAAQCKQHFEGSLGINEVQKLATRAFSAVEKLHYHEADKVYFKRFNDDISIEGKSNTTGLRRKENHIVWGKLTMPLRIKKNDDYALTALEDRTKYVRILTRYIRGHRRYFVQLVQEGLPPRKRQRESGSENSTVGLDIGPSTVAIASDTTVALRELAPNARNDYKAIRRVSRAMDRSKRAMNPNNYNSNGTAKSNCKWVYSKRYKKLANKKKELYRKASANRKASHERLASEIVSIGLDVRVEDMSFVGLQRRAKGSSKNKRNGKPTSKKRFGKSLGSHAPAAFLGILDRKLRYHGKSLKKINTQAVKASQFNHTDSSYKKKSLSERWSLINDIPVQRDLYSAFLIANTTDDLNSVDTNLCNQRWTQFINRHNKEVKRIKSMRTSSLSWYVGRQNQKMAS